MKSLTLLWRKMAEDLAIRCLTSTTLDYNKLESRTENEGISFLTITLPSFGKDFEQCLERGAVGSTDFAGFKRRGGLPLFLGGFLSQVFCPSSGVLLAEPCIDSIFAVRQLTGVFAKILLPCSDSRVEDAMQGFVECEQEIGATGDLDLLRRASRVLFTPVLNHLDQMVYTHSLVPKHGPGATADHLTGNGKWDQKEWTTRLESIFPSGEYLIPNWRYHYRQDDVDLLEPGQERPVKVTPVPKTLKTPRLIAIEPTCMQYMQQAISLELVKTLESPFTPDGAKNLAMGMIGFTHQYPNRNMACKGSLDGSLSTIDLSEASDRVLNEHVVSLMSDFPWLSQGVQATRSTKAHVPLQSGDVLVELKKFASMGSALCFPMEAMVFLAVAFIGIARAKNSPLDRKLVMSMRGKVRVYGDDIIVPTDYVIPVLHELKAYGFKPNMNKTFWKGKFRESCGGDYYDGVDVSIARCRRVLPTKRGDAQEVVSLASFRNHCYERGLWKTANWIDSRLQHLLGAWPIVESTSPGLGRFSFAFKYQEERQHPHYHSPQVRAYTVVSRPPRSLVSGEGALLKCLLKQGSEPFADARHLERQGRPWTVDIKSRWVSPF